MTNTNRKSSFVDRNSASWGRTLWDGTRRGLLATGKLMLVIVPVYTGMAVLKYVGILQIIAGWCRPAMHLFGLPGDAALALVLGNFLNLYSAIGVMASLKLPHAQMTILSVILLFSHSQILESSVFFQMKTKYGILWAIRLVTALIVGYALHFVIR
jgi:spore maturation protein SpmB